MIEVRSPVRIRRITLEKLREVFGFEPPVSYRILEPDEPLYKYLARRIH